MTKREARKYVVDIIKKQLQGDILNGSEWLHDGFDESTGGHGFNEKDQARVMAAVRKFIDADSIIAWKEPRR